MNIVNLTPHDVVIIVNSEGESVTIPPSGHVARVDVMYMRVEPMWPDGFHRDIPTYRRIFGLPKWPDVDDDGETRYIVSSMFLESAKLSKDFDNVVTRLFAPGELIREPADDSARQALISQAKSYLSSAQLEDYAAPLIADFLDFVKAQKPQPGRIVGCLGLVVSD